MFKRTIAADQSHHPSHSGRTFRAFDVQLTVERALSIMTMPANVIGPLHVDSTQDRQNLFGAHLMKARLLATRAGHFSGDFTARFLQQFFEHRRTGLMHRRASGHLHRFQVQPSRFAQIGEDDPQQLIYLLGDFLLDGFRRFFSSGATDSTDRN